jgi:hypothetical protein
MHRYHTRYDDASARETLGIESRSLVDTYRDTVRWLHDAGWSTGHQAGTVEEAAAPVGQSHG